MLATNSRLDEIQAVVLNVKLKHLVDDNNYRKEIAKYYIKNLNNSCVKLPCLLPMKSNVYHLFPILCTRRVELQDYLSTNCIGTVIHYPIPPHKQECYKEWNHIVLPITEYIAKHELSLPNGPTISFEEVKKVV